MKRWRALAAAGMAVALGASVAQADVASDRAAAVLVYPVIHISKDRGIDTLVQISNTSSDLVKVRCFYVNANGRCSDSGKPCFTGSECSARGFCVPGWIETDFELYLTAQQPLAWLASQGLKDFPLRGGFFPSGPTGQTNAGSRVPGAGEDPFVGELKCIAVDSQNRPVDRNVLVGSATVVQHGEDIPPAPLFTDVTHNSAIGIPAVTGANNGDNKLILGEEYAGCPETLILDHYFDGASNPVTGDEIRGVLNLVPCTQDFVSQDTNRITAQFLVFNEFEQRLSTSVPVECDFVRPLSLIDTRQSNRSIFSAAVSGTLTGQTRIRGVGTGGHGLLGSYYDLHGTHSSSVNIQFQGVSSELDVIRLP